MLPSHLVAFLANDCHISQHAPEITPGARAPQRMYLVLISCMSFALRCSSSQWRAQFTSCLSTDSKQPINDILMQNKSSIPWYARTGLRACRPDACRPALCNTRQPSFRKNHLFLETWPYQGHGGGLVKPSCLATPNANALTNPVTPAERLTLLLTPSCSCDTECKRSWRRRSKLEC